MRSRPLAFTISSVLAIASFHALAQQGPGPGAAVPLAGLTPAERQAFDEGNRAFTRHYDIADGLGPVFNDEACADCHRGGGGSNRTVTRVGRLDRSGFDPLTELGGSLMQSRGIGSVTTVVGTHEFVGERTPSQATRTTLRRSTSVRGLGFVDAVPDETWVELARAELDADESTAGRVNLVLDLSTGLAAVGPC